MHCSHCGCKELVRVRRSGFLEVRLLPLLGFYPWKCADCRSKFLLRHRGKKTKKLTPQTIEHR